MPKQMWYIKIEEEQCLIQPYQALHFFLGFGLNVYSLSSNINENKKLYYPHHCILFFSNNLTNYFFCFARKLFLYILVYTFGRSPTTQMNIARFYFYTNFIQMVNIRLNFFFAQIDVLECCIKINQRSWG